MKQKWVTFQNKVFNDVSIEWQFKPKCKTIKLNANPIRIETQPIITKAVVCGYCRPSMTNRHSRKDTDSKRFCRWQGWKNSSKALYFLITHINWILFLNLFIENIRKNNDLSTTRTSFRSFFILLYQN